MDISPEERDRARRVREYRSFRNLLIWFPLLMLAVAAYFMHSSDTHRTALRDHGVTTMAMVEDVRPNGSVDYSFEVGDREYWGHVRHGPAPVEIGAELPVTYLPEDPEVRALLPRHEIPDPASYSSFRLRSITGTLGIFGALALLCHLVARHHQTRPIAPYRRFEWPPGSRGVNPVLRPRVLGVFLPAYLILVALTSWGMASDRGLRTVARYSTAEAISLMACVVLLLFGPMVWHLNRPVPDVTDAREAMDYRLQHGRWRMAILGTLLGTTLLGGWLVLRFHK